ncbi:MAG: hypothetical protein AAES65_15810 [Candidatus Thiodiazotropha sp. (ex. Lucinoma kazani)]
MNEAPFLGRPATWQGTVGGEYGSGEPGTGPGPGFVRSLRTRAGDDRCPTRALLPQIRALLDQARDLQGACRRHGSV